MKMMICFYTTNYNVTGRKPARAEIEKHYATVTPNFRCADYEDFRVLLEKERAVDAVVCATPDHLHALISIMSMRAGKHMYCEKPLTHNLWEGREVARVARESGVATQMGNQGHATIGIRQTVEFIHAGAIGKVREVHAWHTGGRWNPALLGRPAGTSSVPAGLNWDMWQGQTPLVDYVKERCHQSFRVNVRVGPEPEVTEKSAE